MSIIDITGMTSSSLVAQYVVELLGKGHFLSRDDYSRVEAWLQMAGSADELLLVLEDVLPERIQKSRDEGRSVFSLSSVKKTVERRLNDRRSMAGTPVNGG